VIKTVVKLLIALVILNATFRTGLVTWNYYQLRDEAQQQLVFGASTPTAVLHERILRRAADLDIPLAPDGLTVTRDGIRTTAEARYTQPLEYFPNQIYPVDLSFTVDALSMTSGAIEQSPR
jgi:hypothetical protein